MDRQLANLKKQNDGMEASLTAKNVKFTKLNLDSMDPESELLMLQTYNEYLKNLSKQNRPPPQEKPKPQPQLAREPSVPSEEDEEVVYKEVKPVYSTIANMEDIKRAFFSKEYETALELIQQHPFKFYKGCYKYADDNTGRPAFVAKNLLRGFVQGLDDYRKYLMVCFRCIIVNAETKEYKYPSYWIVNSNDNLQTILGSLYDDYEFTEVENIVEMYQNMRKNENENDETLVGEVYLH